MEESDFQHAMANITIMKAAANEVLRFYPVQLRKKESKADTAPADGKDADMTKEDVEQIWILRLSRKESGRKMPQTLETMQMDGSLKDMMEVQLREDRAPQGSIGHPIPPYWGCSHLGG